jgi:GPH family glycoside/pentoside/hexuronide:cation symporter
MQLRETIGYAVGDFGINLYFISAMTYLLFFYTDVMGLSATTAAGVFALARVVDAITDPIMGMIAERTRTRFGRLRPWVILGALPLAAITVLTFTVPDLDANGKLWWAYTTYLLFGVLYTVVTIPYSALTASLTSDYATRTQLSTWRMACAFTGGLTVSVGTMPFVGLFDDRADGFQALMLVFAVVATGLLLVTFKSTEERVAPAPEQELTVKQSMQAVFLNKPLLIVIGIFSCGMLSFTIRQTLTVYYFSYNLQRPDLIPWYFGSTLLVMLVGLITVPSLAARFGKSGALVLGGLLTIVACFGFYFTQPDALGWVFFWGCLVALGGTPVAVLGWAMIPDTVEYAQWKLGVRADGSIYSMASFFQKLAKALGGAGVALALGMVGYLANEAQTPDTLARIHEMFTLLPMVLMVLLIVLARVYPLDEETHARIKRELPLDSATSTPLQQQ